MPRMNLKDYKKAYAKVPRLAVDLLIHKDSQVLLTKRAIEPLKGYWHMPGGTVFKEETTLQAVKRIAKDELGVSIKIDGPFGYYDIFDKTRDTVLVFTGQIKGKVKTNYQATEAKYFERLPKKMIKQQRQIIKHWLDL